MAPQLTIMSPLLGPMPAAELGRRHFHVIDL
jgi:hypothetical protein